GIAAAASAPPAATTRARRSPAGSLRARPARSSGSRPRRASSTPQVSRPATRITNRLRVPSRLHLRDASLGPRDHPPCAGAIFISGQQTAPGELALELGGIGEQVRLPPPRAGGGDVRRVVVDEEQPVRGKPGACLGDRIDSRIGLG